VAFYSRRRRDLAVVKYVEFRKVEREQGISAFRGRLARMKRQTVSRQYPIDPEGSGGFDHDIQGKKSERWEPAQITDKSGTIEGRSLHLKGGPAARATFQHYDWRIRERSNMQGG